MSSMFDGDKQLFTVRSSTYLHMSASPGLTDHINFVGPFVPCLSAPEDAGVSHTDDGLIPRFKPRPVYTGTSNWGDTHSNGQRWRISSEQFIKRLAGLRTWCGLHRNTFTF